MRSTWLLLAVIVAILGCDKGAEPGSAGPSPGATSEDGVLDVVAVNYPLAYFAERIAGEQAAIVMPVPRDVDPAFWRPDRDAIAGIQGADLVLLNGAGYAAWIDTVTLATSRLVDTSVGVRDRLLPLEDHVSHTHGPEGAHEHGSTAFTTWLDPEIAIAQAGAIADALSQRLPGQAGDFAAALEALANDLRGLDEALRALVAPAPETPVLFSHPVYQYLEARYGLNGRSLHWEPHSAPPEEAWEALAQTRAEFPAAWMIWEGEPLPETAARLRQLGVQSVVFDPCGNRPEVGDYLTVMRENVENLRPVFGP